jgi:hypothetical protein
VRLRHQEKANYKGKKEWMRNMHKKHGLVGAHLLAMASVEKATERFQERTTRLHQTKEASFSLS